jgi:hypothetical protein
MQPSVIMRSARSNKNGLPRRRRWLPSCNTSWTGCSQRSVGWTMPSAYREHGDVSVTVGCSATTNAQPACNEAGGAPAPVLSSGSPELLLPSPEHGGAPLPFRLRSEREYSATSFTPPTPPRSSGRGGANLPNGIAKNALPAPKKNALGMRVQFKIGRGTRRSTCQTAPCSSACASSCGRRPL